MASLVGNAFFGEMVALSFSSSLDNLSIGFSSGVALKYISAGSNICIALVNASFTLAVMLFGDFVKRYMGPEIGNFIGASVFLLLAAADLRAFYLLIMMTRAPQQSPAPPAEAATGGGGGGGGGIIAEAAAIPPVLSCLSFDEKEKVDVRTQEEDDEEERQQFEGDEMMMTTNSMILQRRGLSCCSTTTSTSSSSIANFGQIACSSSCFFLRWYKLLPSSATNKTAAAADQSRRPISYRETALICIATSFTNIASGLAASLAGYNAYIMAIMAVVSNFSLLLLGQFIGGPFLRRYFGALIPENYVKLVSSLILLAIAISNFVV